MESPMENPDIVDAAETPHPTSRVAILQPHAGVNASTAASTMGWARIAESGRWIPCFRSLLRAAQSGRYLRYRSIESHGTLGQKKLKFMPYIGFICGRYIMDYHGISNIGSIYFLKFSL